MESGFTTYKDVLDVVVVPVTLALLALLFPAIKSWHIRRRFKKLIERELREISPYPPKASKIGPRAPEAKEAKTWALHQQKRCIHKEIFDKPSENRDFILSLPPDLVYFLSNLWDPKNLDDPNAKQWMNYLGELRDYFMGIEGKKKEKNLNKVYDNWDLLIKEYQAQPKHDSIT